MTRTEYARLSRILRREGRSMSDWFGGCRGRSAHIDHLINDRARLAAEMGDYAEGGEVITVWGGMDCDGSQFAGVCRRHNALVVEVWKYIEDRYNWADGPTGYYFAQPSVAGGIEESHRDLALEAFEDGHPHVLYA
jgi:hypothetical protein